jgi:hypothetical protein
MFIAVALDGRVMEVVMDERVSLDGMIAYANMKQGPVMRFECTAQDFVDFSEGEDQRVDYDCRDGKLIPKIILDNHAG